MSDISGKLSENKDLSATISPKGGTLSASLMSGRGVGHGIPDGGTTGQVLTKASNDDYDATWQNQAVTSVAGKTGAVTLDGGDVTYSDSAAYGSGTVGKEVSDLKSALDNKVDLTGENQVTPQNIEGMTEAGAGISDNLFPRATLVANNKYLAGISGTTGKAYLLDINGLDTYIIPVDGESVYTFTNCRTAIVVSDLEYTPVGELLTYATSIDSEGGKYILFSFNPTKYPINGYSITKPVTKYTIPSNWIIPDDSDAKSPIDSISGTGTLNIIGRSALKDGELITFKGFFDTFSEFSLNFTSTSTSTITNYIKVDSTNITIKNTTTTPTPQAHGLTIQNDVTLTAQFVDGTMKITLYSNGETWTSTVDWNQTGGTVSQPQIVPNGMVFTDAMLAVSYGAVKRGIWYFGDSYTGIKNPDRWCYYLKEDGFSGNALINGSAGSTSNGASTALSALIKYGTPKYAVMATGMNDGSDTDGNPPNLWINSRDAFITACQNNGIEPIFATIPTVPTVNNEAKNAWVKASGYRYIDFAKAVGADGTGAWYSGMLSGDNVHPTAKGAKALYTQVLIDLPEITVT